ncbi:MAG TPA: segregation/condensation protein A [bacterium]|jgi:segregation and condensation protein A
MYAVKVPGFEGPLDLLLSLAQQGQVDLLEIPLGQIAEDYLAATGGTFDLEEATEVLWTLAALVEMKSRLLVPKPVDTEALVVEEPAGDLQEQLEEKLQEYRAFKEVASALRALEDYQHHVFARAPDEDAGEVILEGVSVQDLFQAFQVVLSRAKDDVGEVREEEVKVAQQMEVLLRALSAQAEGILFPALFDQRATKLQVIVTFLALLELIKDRRVRVQQSGPFESIRVVLMA